VGLGVCAIVSVSGPRAKGTDIIIKFVDAAQRENSKRWGIVE